MPGAQKPGTRLPFHHRGRGQRNDLRRAFLPIAASGTRMIVPDAALGMAI